MYQCANCHGTFEQEWTDADADLELQRNFPGFARDECLVVCDDCYTAAMRSIRQSPIDNRN